MGKGGGGERVVAKTRSGRAGVVLGRRDFKLPRRKSAFASNTKMKTKMNSAPKQK